MENQKIQGTEYIHPQAYVFEGGITMQDIQGYTLINELMPSESDPCPSQLEKAAVIIE